MQGIERFRLGRRQFLGGALAFTAAPAFLPAVSTAARAAVPSYYPAGYNGIVEASKAEGPMMIYTSVSTSNLQPAIDGFTKLYPWTKVELLELLSEEIFTRISLEASAKTRTADFMSDVLTLSFAQFVKENKILDYTTPEAPRFPSWARVIGGVYSMGIKPMFLLYNKLTVPEQDWPTSMADVANLVKTQPDQYSKAIATYTIDQQVGRGLFYSWVKHNGESAMDILKTILPATIEERSAGNMVAKMQSGEYKIAYFIPSTTLLRSLNPAFEQLIGWSLPKDGVPMFGELAAVTSVGSSPNTGKMFLDFLMSDPGQADLALGGIIPFHGEFKSGSLVLGYDTVEKEVGAEHTFTIGSTEDESAKIDAFVTQWRAMTGG